MIAITHGRDPRVRAVLGGLEFPDQDALDLTVVDLDAEGQPQAVLAGFRWGEVPVMEHLACRPGRFSALRVRRLVRAFGVEAWRRGWGRVSVTALDPQRRQGPMLRRLCRRLGGTPYATAPNLEWVAFTLRPKESR